MANVASPGPGASYLRFTQTGRKFSPSQVRWMETQIRKGTTRGKMTADWKRRFPGEKALGNRTYTRARSFVQSSDRLAEVIETGKVRGGPSSIEFNVDKATLFGDPQADRVMVSGRVTDSGGNRHFNFSARRDKITGENVADTAVDTVEGVYSVRDSAPITDEIDNPEDELGERIHVISARHVKADTQTRRRRG